MIERSSGILLHISSLPSRYGIGSLGRQAFSFVDFLQSSKQHWWQLLPVNPTGYGDSPYSPLSAFAGNPYFIDLELLRDDGLLSNAELESAIRDGERVDYGDIYLSRKKLLRLASSRGERTESYNSFCLKNKSWLRDYSLYCALKEHFDMKPISQWPKDISNRDPKAVLRYSEELKDEIETHCYIQYLFYKQYFSLKEYANKHGVKLLGDIPIYVPEDSADFFAEREQFQTDSDGRPSAVSGVPPDYFSESGQLWGTPLYNWQFQKADGYRWWQKRLGHQLSMFDALRIDHFRGFADYWSIPYGSEDARGGHWEKGPGADFFDELSQRFCNPQIIAEDLGIIDDDVVELLRHTGYPGMKVLQFAFDGSASPYLPQNYDENCVVYTGTHDNDTTAGFFEGEGDTPKLAESYLSDFDGSMIRRLIVCALRSKASLAVIPMQDWLELGSDARMNTPSTVNGNWSWRLKENELSDSLAKELADLSENSKRS